MKQITTIEELQDAIALEKEIYNVSCYETNKGKLVFSKSFSLWLFDQQVMEKTWEDERWRPIKDCAGRSKTLTEWIESKSLFWSEPIVLELKEVRTNKKNIMKHYKKGRDHIFEFGEISITSIKLKQSQYEELSNYFAKQTEAKTQEEIVVRKEKVEFPCFTCLFQERCCMIKRPCANYIYKKGEIK